MWATVNVDPANLDANADVRFFDQPLAHLVTAYDIDQNSVYLMGMSNGASFVQLLAAARSDDIAAIVAHSGSKPTSLSDFYGQFPIMLVVGAEDSAASATQADAEQYRSAGHLVKFVSVQTLAHEWSTRHNTEMWSFLSQHSVRSEDEAEPIREHADGK